VGSHRASPVPWIRPSPWPNCARTTPRPICRARPWIPSRRLPHPGPGRGPPSRSLHLAGGHHQLPFLVFPAVQTVSPPTARGHTKITVHHGWKPGRQSHPGDLVLARNTPRFPTSTRHPPSRACTPSTRPPEIYAHAESLEPWRGYFAWYQGARDSTLDLLSDPVPAPLATKAGKRGVGAWAGMSFGLTCKAVPAILLGASPLARERAGHGGRTATRGPPPGRGTAVFRPRRPAPGNRHGPLDRGRPVFLDHRRGPAGR